MKITAVTGSRADWNGLGMVAKRLRTLSVDVNVVAIGQHAESEDSLRTVIEDGFDPHLIRTNFRDEMAVGCGSAALAVQGALVGDRPDLVLLLGDRFEIMGAASAAALLNIPIAHIGGGDITEGSIDNAMRYAISALSAFHFVTNESSQQRLFNVTKPLLASYFDHTVYCVGNPALDRIAITPIVPRETFFRDLQLIESEKNILVAYHAATKHEKPWVACDTMLNVLDGYKNASFLILGTNADTGSEAIGALFDQFIARDLWSKRKWHGNLSPSMFYSALTHCDVMIGNSSAGLIETPQFGIPVVNIGQRQQGRAHARNVHTTADTATEIDEALMMALGDPRLPCANPYGDGHSAERIALAIIKELKRR